MKNPARMDRIIDFMPERLAAGDFYILCGTMMGPRARRKTHSLCGIGRGIQEVDEEKEVTGPRSNLVVLTIDRAPPRVRYNYSSTLEDSVYIRSAHAFG